MTGSDPGFTRLLAVVGLAAAVGCRAEDPNWTVRDCTDSETAYIERGVEWAGIVAPAVQDELVDRYGSGYASMAETAELLEETHELGLVFCAIPEKELLNEAGGNPIGWTVWEDGELFINVDSDLWTRSIASWEETRSYGDLDHDSIEQLIDEAVSGDYETLRGLGHGYFVDSAEAIEILVHEAAHLANPDFRHEDGAAENGDLVYDAGDLVVAAIESELWGAESDFLSELWAVGWVELSAGYYHSCGLRESGAVYCWGDDEPWDTGIPAERFIAISSGGTRACGINETGDLRCWGKRYSGTPANEPPEGSFIGVSQGACHSCAVRDDSTIHCWGWESSSENAPPPGAFQQVAAGWDHSCAIDPLGSVTCWGGDGYGEDAPPDDRFVHVTSGTRRSCGILEQGGIRCWGGLTSRQDLPPSGTDFSTMSTGDFHHCALREDATAECWGRWGVTAEATDALDGARFTAITVGSYHTCAVTLESRILCWGCDVEGLDEAQDRGQCDPP